MTQLLAPGELAGFEPRRFRYEGKHEMPAHAHEQGQFLCIVSGVISQETDAGIWIVPQQRLVWIPPGTRHAAHSHGVVEGWLVLAPAYFAEHLPGHVCVLRTSPLLAAALERLTEPEPQPGLTELLVPVILFELDQADAEELQVPLPRSAPLRAIAQQLLDAPANPRGLDDWAAEAAMSTRSFTRHFEAETGMPFSEWRRRVAARRAVELLAAGESVANVASGLGYESVSAFIAMFKRLHGTSPARFMAAMA
jgi:AraC-like DNA-binding protein